MKAFIIFYLFLSLNAYSQFVEVFRPDIRYLFKTKVDKHQKNVGSLEIISTYRDSEGDSYALIKTEGTYPLINGQPTLRMEEVSSTGTLYTIVRLNSQGRMVWSINLKKFNGGFEISDFQVSPQGNVALVLEFTGKLQIPQSLKEYRALKTDLLFLFFKKKDGTLLKDLHFTGVDGETSGKVHYGTGGELLITLLSSSNKVSYDHGYYNFNKSKYEVPQKRLIIALKKNYFPRWRRSLEPDSLVDLTHYDEGRVFMALDFSENFGFYRSGRLLTYYLFPPKTQPKGIGLSLNQKGHKDWDITLRAQKFFNRVKRTKVFPDSSVGLYALTEKKMDVGFQETISTKLTSQGTPVFLNFNKLGQLQHHTLLHTSPHFIPMGRDSEQTVMRAPKKQEEETYINGSNGSSTLRFSKHQSCENLVIFDQDLSPAYQQEMDSCLIDKSFDKAHIKMTEGHLEILSHNHKDLIYLYKFKYGEEGLSEEIIPGLAYNPNFIHEKRKNEKPRYSLSYALPEKIHGAMVYFVPEGMGHKEFLLNPLIQTSLNLAYFRGYAIMTIWSSEKKMNFKTMEKLFSPLVKNKVVDLKWPWYFNGYGLRGREIMVNYPKPILGKIIDQMLNPKALILWNLDHLPQLGTVDEHAQRKLDESYDIIAKNQRPTVFISSNQVPSLRKQMDKLYHSMLNVPIEASHIFQESRPISKDSFSTLFMMGKTNSELIFKQLLEKNCLNKDFTFRENFGKQDFKKRCFNDLEFIKPLDPNQKLFALRFFSNHIFSRQFTPFYDKEIYNFLEALN